MNLKNLFYLFLSMFLLSSNAYAGIPIKERTPEVVIESSLSAIPTKNQKKLSLKQKIAKKLIAKKMEGDNKAAAIVFAILIPFVGVAIYQDRIGPDFWITLLLTLLLYVPGLIYALSIVLKRTR